MNGKRYCTTGILMACAMTCAAFAFNQFGVRTGIETRVDAAPASWGIAEQRVQTVAGDSAHLIGWIEYPPLGGDPAKIRVVTRRETGDQIQENPVAVSTTPSTTGGLNSLQLDARGNVVYAAWQRVVEFTPIVNYEVRFSRSFDGGKTWEADRRMTPQGLDTSNGFALARGSGMQVWVTFSGTRGTQSHVDFVRSTDGGAHWTLPDQIDHSPVGASRPAIAATDNGNIAVVWSDGRVLASGQGGSIFANSSTDAGFSFHHTDALVSTLETTFAQVSATANGRFSAFFAASGGSGTDAFSSSSNDGGLLWSAPLRFDEGQGGIVFYTLQATAGGNGQVHTVVVYSQGAGLGVYYRGSDDNGRTYRAPVRLDMAPTGTQVFFPNIAASPNGVVIVSWAQLRTGTSPGIVLARVSKDRGRTWSGIVKLSGSAITSRAFPVLSLDNGIGGAAVAWTQRKSPDQKLFFNTLETTP